jgi:hypothetical protein
MTSWVLGFAIGGSRKGRRGRDGPTEEVEDRVCGGGGYMEEEWAEGWLPSRRDGRT